MGVIPMLMDRYRDWCCLIPAAVPGYFESYVQMTLVLIAGLHRPGFRFDENHFPTVLQFGVLVNYR